MLAAEIILVFFLCAAEKPAADAQAKWQEQALEHATIGTQHQSGAQQHHAHAQCLGTQRGFLPGAAQLCSEVLGDRLGALVQLALAAVAVPAHRRPRQQQGGTLLASLQPGQQLFAEADTAGPQQRLALAAPGTVGDRRAGQVDHRIQGYRHGLASFAKAEIHSGHHSRKQAACVVFDFHEDRKLAARRIRSACDGDHSTGEGLTGPMTDQLVGDEEQVRRIFGSVQSAYFFTTPDGDIKLVNATHKKLHRAISGTRNQPTLNRFGS